jgi:heat shock protein HslJ
VQRGIVILRHWAAHALVCIACAGALIGVAIADSAFPFGRDLMLDVRPMKGSKRVPIIEIDDGGAAVIDLWCNSMQGQAVIAGDTITIMTGPRTERACPPDRIKADEDMIEALQQVTNWRRTAGGVTLNGPRTLNFRLPTN